MKLSELKTGESGVIVKVYGHGGFRKRIVEMGFIRGTRVDVVQNAPLHDPVEYKILDYEVSLRRAEAELIEVISNDNENDNSDDNQNFPTNHEVLYNHPTILSEEILRQIAIEKGKTINVAFVGNPNSGKTSLFNVAGNAHEHVGNYSGVTIDAKKGKLDFDGYHINIIDLPGTYSLTAYTPEELYVRKYIIEQTPDIIINVVDAGNLERNLYLTSQLIDMDVPIIMALNMYDEFRKSGNKLNISQLSILLGVPIVSTVGRTGEGVQNLLRCIIDVYEGQKSLFKHIHVNHGRFIEEAIEQVEMPIRKNPEPHHNYSGRFMAIKLLENDKQIESVVNDLPNANEIFAVRDKCQQKLFEEFDEDSENAITDAKYGFVQGALKECLIKQHQKIPNRELTKKIDTIITNKWLGYIIFLAIMYSMFYCTFTIGQIPMDWIDAGISWLNELLKNTMPESIFKNLVTDGIIAGVGGVIVFLPNILILYAFISWMEDSGYMARVAFIMDRIMHRMGLHGKSFIPMIMGFGCNIPAIMATRTIEDRKSRLITMLIIPMMSCSARLPVYIIVIGAFFPHNQSLILFSLYLAGIIMSILMAHLFSKFIIRGETSPFVMELPPYRLPSGKSVCRHTWNKGMQYLKKMGTTILAASVIVWALSYFPHNEQLTHAEQMEQSYIGQIGKFIEPAIEPCGLQWREGVSIVTGIAAKEIVASTMSVLYSDVENSMTQTSALAFLFFVLLYMPCIPACVCIRHESGHWKWTIFTAIYTTLIAWLCATAIYQIGNC